MLLNDNNHSNQKHYEYGTLLAEKVKAEFKASKFSHLKTI